MNRERARIRWSMWMGCAALAMSPLITPRTVERMTGGEPSWPQKFEIRQGESQGFAFVVTQAGPVTVSVSSQGAPIVVSVSGPVAQPLQQRGSGTLSISHTATAAEVQKSSIWRVDISAMNGAPPAQKVAPIIAQGTISVQHPPADMRMAAAEIQRSLSAMQAAAPPRPVAFSSISPMQAAYTRQLVARQAAAKQALLTKITSPVPPPPNVNRPMPMGPAPMVNTPARRTPGGAPVGHAVGAGASGAPAPAPQITGLSVNRGQPGDPVLINGSGFGASQAQGKVHLLIAPGTDVVAEQFESWSDTQILTYLPFVNGMAAFSGQFYVEAGNQRSQLMPFQFLPLISFVQLDLKLESIVPIAGGFASIKGTNACRMTPNSPWEPGTCVDHSVSPNTAFQWTSNDDEFFPNLILKNGWVTDAVDFRVASGDGGGAYLAEKREGTNSPYAKVHWWVNPFGETWYTLTITIKGPIGVPYQ